LLACSRGLPPFALCPGLCFFCSSPPHPTILALISVVGGKHIPGPHILVFGRPHVNDSPHWLRSGAGLDFLASHDPLRYADHCHS
jgi:hypothetical protein